MEPEDFQPDRPAVREHEPRTVPWILRQPLAHCPRQAIEAQPHSIGSLHTKTCNLRPLIGPQTPQAAARVPSHRAPRYPQSAPVAELQLESPVLDLNGKQLQGARDAVRR